MTCVHLITVPMMDTRVDDNHSTDSVFVDGVLRHDGGIIDKAKTIEGPTIRYTIDARMVARWPYRTEGTSGLARQDDVSPTTRSRNARTSCLHGA